MNEEFKGIKSPVAIKLEMGNNCLPETAAGRLEFVINLLEGVPYYDEDGMEIGRSEPLITKEEALKLLGFKP